MATQTFVSRSHHRGDRQQTVVAGHGYRMAMTSALHRPTTGLLTLRTLGSLVLVFSLVFASATTGSPHSRVPPSQIRMAESTGSNRHNTQVTTTSSVNGGSSSSSNSTTPASTHNPSTGNVLQSICPGYRREKWQAFFTTDCADRAAADLTGIDGGVGTGRFLLVVNGIRWEHRRMDEADPTEIPAEAIITVMYADGNPYYRYFRAGNETAQDRPAKFLRRSHRARSRQSSVNAVFRKMSSTHDTPFQWKVQLSHRCVPNAAGNLVCNNVVIHATDKKVLQLTIEADVEVATPSSHRAPLHAHQNITAMAVGNSSGADSAIATQATAAGPGPEEKGSPENSSPDSRRHANAGSDAKSDTPFDQTAPSSHQQRRRHVKHVCEKFRMTVIC